MSVSAQYVEARDQLDALYRSAVRCETRNTNLERAFRMVSAALIEHADDPLLAVQQATRLCNQTIKALDAERES